MGTLPEALHRCALEDVEESEADVKADGIPQGKCGVDGKIGEGKKCPDQHGADGNGRQGSNHKAHTDSSRFHQTFCSNRIEVRQDTSGIDRDGVKRKLPHT